MLKQPTPPSLLRRARALRKNPTDAEKHLWNFLKGRRCLGAKFRRQQPIPPYIVDFCCFAARLVIELDGKHHSRPDVTNYDSSRTEYLRQRGYRVLRFSNRDVLEKTDSVLESIREALGRR